MSHWVVIAEAWPTNGDVTWRHALLISSLPDQTLAPTSTGQKQSRRLRFCSEPMQCRLYRRRNIDNIYRSTGPLRLGRVYHVAGWIGGAELLLLLLLMLLILTFRRINSDDNLTTSTVDQLRRSQRAVNVSETKQPMGCDAQLAAGGNARGKCSESPCRITSLYTCNSCDHIVVPFYHSRYEVSWSSLKRPLSDVVRGLCKEYIALALLP